MVRKYKRKTEDSTIDPNLLLEAIKAIKIEKKSVVSVAQTHNVPKSNLFRYLGKIYQQFTDFANAPEQQLLEFVSSLTKRCGQKPVSFLCSFPCSIHLKKKNVFPSDF